MKKKRKIKNIEKLNLEKDCFEHNINKDEIPVWKSQKIESEKLKKSL